MQVLMKLRKCWLVQNKEKLMKRIITLLILFVALGTATTVFSKEKNINVPPVGVKEEFVPTPEDIHRDVPIEQKCSSCHTEANQDIESKPITHFMTHRECDQCHIDRKSVV